MSYELTKLLAAEKKYGKIILGVDFDDTLYPYTDDDYTRQRTTQVRKLIKQVENRAVICLWTVANEWSIGYKTHICDTYGLRIDFINESPISHGEGVRKPHFNILLDDKAGLNETIKILEEFINAK